PRSARVPAGQIPSLLVAGLSAADGSTDARTAPYLRSPAVQSPMGSGLAAHATEHGARDHQRLVGGEILRWDDVFRNTGAHEPDGAGMRGDGGRLFAEPDHGD